MTFGLLLLTALFLDLIFGEPKWMTHPVQIIGTIARSSEKICRILIPSQLWSGVLTFLITLAISVGSVILLLVIAGHFSSLIQTCLAVVILYLLVAIKSLLEHSKAVYTALVADDLILARTSVGRIVGRETDHLTGEEVSRACIETVAENFVDGIVAPLFWAVLFTITAIFFPLSPIGIAAIGMTVYKTINTMDSMFGYKNERYHLFGTMAARMDDVANWLPARIGGLCLVLAAFVLRQNFRNSFQVLRKDRLNHASPNAGHPEAAVAGALGVQLGGTARYFGREVEKPTIGVSLESISPEKILQVNTLVFIATLLFVFLALVGRVVFLAVVV